MGYEVLSIPGHQCSIPTSDFVEGTRVRCCDRVLRDGRDVECGGVWALVKVRTRIFGRKYTLEWRPDSYVNYI